MNPNQHSWPVRAVLGFAMAASLATGAVLWHGQTSADEKPIPKTPQHQADLGHAKALSHAFRAAAEATVPSVVTITSETKVRPVRGNVNPRGENQFKGENPFKGTPFEQHFKEFKDHGGQGNPFGSFGGSPHPRMGVGAGVIIDKSGLILTNNHVVEGATEVTVRLSDGREFQGYDIKTDKHSDLAIVHIKGAGNLPAAHMGNSDEAEIGDWVIAVGNPFNQELTVSAGIISGKGRTLGSGSRTQYLQTDAAINPGNSGGPLVNLDGEVVGINTAIASSSGGSQGVGFAIPMNHAKWVVDQLAGKGSVQRAYLGVKVGEVSSDLAEQFGVQRHEGVLVVEVTPDSPAAKAGFEVGDIITEYAGKRVGRPSDLQSLVERTPMDRQESVKIMRNDKPQTLTVGVKPLPEQREEVLVNQPATESRSNSAYAHNELGLEVAEMSNDEAEHLGFAGYEGVVVTHVNPDGLAAEHAVTEGTLIMKVGKHKVTNLEEFKKAMADQSVAKGVLLLVRTAEGNRFVVLKS